MPCSYPFPGFEAINHSLFHLCFGVKFKRTPTPYPKYFKKGKLISTLCFEQEVIMHNDIFEWENIH